jgi:hypothetical protein
MQNKLEGLITPFEQGLKNEDFNYLRKSETRIYFEDEYFVGAFYNIEGNKYLFTGINQKLLSYQGFIDFKDYENDKEKEIGENLFILNKDGILIVEINDLSAFKDIISKDKIPNYQDKITISDIDEMNEISFLKYFVYVLRKNNFSNIEEEKLNNDLIVDLKATYNEIDYFFEIKLFKDKNIIINISEIIKRFQTKLLNQKLIIITNVKVIQNNHNNIYILDREDLYQLSKDINSLTKMLNIN